MTFSVTDWIILGFAVLIIIILLYFFGRINLYKLVNTAIVYAEEGFATNQQRLDGAIDWIIDKMPVFLKPFVSRKWIQQAVQSAFDVIKQYTKIDKKD